MLVGLEPDLHFHPHIQQCLPGKAQLLGAAVDQNQIGQITEFAADGAKPCGFTFSLFAEAMLKAPAQNLVQGGKIVRALDGFDAEAAVFLLRSHAIDKNHHAGNAQHTLGVGDVIALDAPWRIRQAKGASQSCRSTGGALLSDGCAGVTLFQGVGSVLGSQQDQVVLLAALGRGQAHSAPLLLTQPQFKLVLRPLGQGLNQHMARNEVAVLVVLGDELSHHLARILAALAREGEMVAADHASAPDVENMHHRVQTILGQGDDILLAPVGLDGNLAFHQALHIADLVAKGGGALVLHSGSAVHHVLAQHLEHLLVVSPQEGQHTVHHVPVGLFGTLARTGRHALANLIVDAGPGGRLQRQFLAAGSQRKHAAHRLDHLPDCRSADVGAEVLHTVLLPSGLLFYAPCQLQTRKGLLQIHSQVGIMLVILQEDVIVRLVQLDEVALQAQRLQIGIAQEDIEIVDMTDHRRNLGGVLRITEIGAHAVLQIDRLADIDDGALRILHQVAARAFGEHADLGFELLTPVDFRHAEITVLSVDIIPGSLWEVNAQPRRGPPACGGAAPAPREGSALHPRRAFSPIDTRFVTGVYANLFFHCQKWKFD